MSAEAPEIRPKRRKEERPDEILAAALTVFTRDGFSGARLDEIADRAGCTKGTIYVYFDSKEELFRAVVRQLIKPQYRAVDVTLADEHMDTATRLKTFIRGAYRQIIEDPTNIAVIRLLVADGPRFPDLIATFQAEILSVGRALLQETLKRGIDRGEIRKVNLETAPQIINGPIAAEAMRRLMGGLVSIDMDALIDAHLDLLFNGLLVKPKR
jgi:AcrR family transcriptional regulator